VQALGGENVIASQDDHSLRAQLTDRISNLWKRTLLVLHLQDRLSCISNQFQCLRRFFRPYVLDEFWRARDEHQLREASVSAERLALLYRPQWNIWTGNRYVSFVFLARASCLKPTATSLRTGRRDLQTEGEGGAFELEIGCKF